MEKIIQNFACNAHAHSLLKNSFILFQMFNQSRNLILFFTFTLLLTFMCSSHSMGQRKNIQNKTLKIKDNQKAMILSDGFLQSLSLDEITTLSTLLKMLLGIPSPNAYFNYFHFNPTKPKTLTTKNKKMLNKLQQLKKKKKMLCFKSSTTNF